MANHTPRPWIATEIGVYPADDSLRPCLIAKFSDGWEASPDEETDEENRRLIAAAPELLAALEAARRELGKQNLAAAKDNMQTDESLALLAQIDAAIRAAKGE